MAKRYSIYVRTDCSFCKKAVSLLEESKLPFIVVVTDKNEELPNIKTLDFNAKFVSEKFPGSSFFVSFFLSKTIISKAINPMIEPTICFQYFFIFSLYSLTKKFFNFVSHLL
mgnify:CR=1 FL=1